MPGKLAHDFFVSLSQKDQAAHELALNHQRELENFPFWPERSNSPFLMELGESLFRLAFPTPEAVSRLVDELATAVAADATLRLWLHTDEPGLAMLPWEYLCLTEEAVLECCRQGVPLAKFQPHTRLPRQETFLTLHPNVSLVRQAAAQPPERALERVGKLKVLVAWANPGPCPDGSGWPAISGIEVEVAAILEALHNLGHNLVELMELKHAGHKDLEKALTSWKPHVLHFAGHGAFPGAPDDPGDLSGPSLVLERKPPRAHLRHEYVTAGELRTWCGQSETLVVVLNACWGARTSASFPGIAHALTDTAHAAAVPAVVAHQIPAAQAVAAGFARRFYENLAIACTIEQAVQAGRQNIIRNSLHGHGIPDWGAPVVFLGVRRSSVFRSERFDPYPIPFGPVTGQYEAIIGRDFIDKRLASFQRQRAGGIFLIIAPPGLGKTAYLARRLQNDKELVHFFYRVTFGTTDPDECVKSLYHGLRARHRILDENPTSDTLELRRRLADLLEKVSARCAKASRQELILIDALDEAGEAAFDHKSAVDVLPPRLPSHVYLLVTSRPGPPVTSGSGLLVEKLAQRADVLPYRLNPESPENQEDAAAFCRRELAGRVAGAGAPDLDSVCTRLAAKAKGNFLVLTLFLSKESLGERLTLAELVEKAQDLTGAVEKQYEEFFKRVADRHGHDRPALALLYRVLSAFAAIPAPVTEDQLASAFGLVTADLHWAFEQISQFLERGGVRQEEQGADTYRLYHETFREFLQHKLKRDLPQAHRSWAEYCLGWRQLKGYPRYYALRHLPAHLLEASLGGA